MTQKAKIVVVGSGAFGTALALSALRAQASVTLIARRPEFAYELKEIRINSRYLGDIFLPEALDITSDLSSLETADFALLATPAQKTLEVIENIKPALRGGTPLVLCAKGIHLEQQKLLSQVIVPVLPNPICVLSGPSFAIEVAKNLPTAVILAGPTIEQALPIAQALRHDRFRCYASDDMIGVQVGGAVKNVIAIASGIVYGKQLGQNAQAALLSRGLAEMTRIGMALGGDQQTFMGLAGVGDLILTGSSMTSRNYSLGAELGKGRSLEEILGSRASVTEGVATSAALYHLTQSRNIYAPIINAVYHILHAPPANLPNGVLGTTIEALLSRQSDTEF